MQVSGAGHTQTWQTRYNLHLMQSIDFTFLIQKAFCMHIEYYVKLYTGPYAPCVQSGITN